MWWILTESCEGFYHFLERSDAVYLLCAEDAFSKAMYAQFEQLMKIREFDAALERWIPFDFITGW